MSLDRVPLLGIPELDDDHLEMCYIIAELESREEENTPVAELVAVLERLIKAAQLHFGHEEQMMERDGYPRFEEHRLHHENLLRYLRMLVPRITDGHMRGYKNLITAIWDWGTVHIDTHDREYANYIRSQSSSQNQAAGVE